MLIFAFSHAMLVPMFIIVFPTMVFLDLSRREGNVSVSSVRENVNESVSRETERNNERENENYIITSNNNSSSNSNNNRGGLRNEHMTIERIMLTGVKQKDKRWHLIQNLISPMPLIEVTDMLERIQGGFIFSTMHIQDRFLSVNDC